MAQPPAKPNGKGLASHITPLGKQFHVRTGQPGAPLSNKKGAGWWSDAFCFGAREARYSSLRRGTFGTVPEVFGGRSFFPSGPAAPSRGGVGQNRLRLRRRPRPRPSSSLAFGRLVGSGARNSKTSLRSSPLPSTTTFTVPPFSSLPNSSSSASGFLMCSWMTRPAGGRRTSRRSPSRRASASPRP